MRSNNSKNKQSGKLSVELSMTIGIFTILLLAVIEIGRWMFIWNAANEMARLGARAAAVCQVNSDRLEEIANFNAAGGLLDELSNAKIDFTYLGTDGTEVGNPGGSGFGDIGFVRTVVKIQPKSVLPFMTPPPLQVQSTRRRESLGVLPGGIETEC